MKRLLSFALLLSLGFFSLPQPTLGASDSSYGLNDTAKAAELIQYNTPVPELIGNIIGTALSLISVVFFILAIYGGFRMMFARGKDDEFTKGKDILIHAIIGMIVILASYAITQFVFDSVKGGGNSGGGDGGQIIPGDDDGGKTSDLYCPTATPTCSIVSANVSCAGGKTFLSAQECLTSLSGNTADPTCLTSGLGRIDCFVPPGGECAGANFATVDECTEKLDDVNAKGVADSYVVCASQKGKTACEKLGQNICLDSDGSEFTKGQSQLIQGKISCQTSAGHTVKLLNNEKEVIDALFNVTSDCAHENYFTCLDSNDNDVSKCFVSGECPS